MATVYPIKQFIVSEAGLPGKLGEQDVDARIYAWGGESRGSAKGWVGVVDYKSGSFFQGVPTKVTIPSPGVADVVAEGVSFFGATQMEFHIELNPPKVAFKLSANGDVFWEGGGPVDKGMVCVNFQVVRVNI